MPRGRKAGTKVQKLTPADHFKALAAARTRSIIVTLRQLQTMNVSRYQYDKQQVDKIHAAVQGELEATAVALWPRRTGKAKEQVAFDL